MKVLVCDPLAQEGLDILKADGSVEVDIRLGLPKEELISIAADYDAILVRSETKITSEVLEKATRLKVVGRAGVGVDNIDVQAATRCGVIVINAPEGNTNAAAEHTLALIACLARHIPQACAALRAGKWARKDYVGTELKGKLLGVIGVGKIGSTVATRALALGMKVIAYDPYISEEQMRSRGFSPGSLEDIYKSSDFITVHMPLNPQTKGMIGQAAFDLMKPTVRLVNVARGGIIDEDALAAAVTSGRVAGAALDVYVSEPCTVSPLFELPNVIVTPHLGASTQEAQTNVSVSVAEEVLEILKGQFPQNAVNMAAVAGDEYEKIKPFMAVAQMLGNVLAGVFDGPVEAIDVTYGAAIAPLKTSLLTGLALKGFLDSTSDVVANLVNVSLMAADRGIKVRESKELNTTTASRMEVTAQAGSKRCVIAGVSLQGTPRLVQIDEFSMDIQPAEAALLVWHTDRPNLIGPATTLLGQAGVNIASMQVSRLAPGGRALMVVTLDSMPPDVCVAAIGGLPGVANARTVMLP